MAGPISFCRSPSRSLGFRKAPRENNPGPGPGGAEADPPEPPEPRLPQPGLVRGPRVVLSLRLHEHRHAADRRLQGTRPIVVAEELAEDQEPALREDPRRLPKETAVRLRGPVVEDVAEEDRVHARGPRVLEEVPRRRPDSALEPRLADLLPRNLEDVGEIEHGGSELRILLGERD